MTKQPYLNAALVFLFIILVVLLMQFGGSLFPDPNEILIGIGMLSLLVLSVAVMGVSFFYQPTILIVERKYVEAGGFLLRSLAAFAGAMIAAFVLAAVF